MRCRSDRGAGVPRGRDGELGTGDVPRDEPPLQRRRVVAQGQAANCDGRRARTGAHGQSFLPPFTLARTGEITRSHGSARVL